MNIEQDKHEKTPADIAAVSAVDSIIRILKPLGRDTAQVFVRVRLYGRSLVGTAGRMRLSISGGRACLDKADLHFMRLLEGNRKRIPHRVPIPAVIHTPKAVLQGQEDAYREALCWVNALESSEDIAAHWSRFETWLSQSAEHEEAHQRVEAALAQAALFGHALQVLGVQEEALVDEISLRLRPSRRYAAFRVWLPLAVAAACIPVGLLVFWNYTTDSSWSSYTASLEQRMFTLADGSILRLDAGTVVRVRVTPTHREIVLERGQVFCEARHEAWRAFYVFVNRNAVHAIGTKFAVIRKSASEFETLVTQGAVQVLVPGTKSSEGARVIVRSGELVLIDAERMHIDHLSSSDVDRRLAWVHGQIALDGTLEQAVEAFNRYNRRQLIIDDPNIRGVPVVGLYDAHSPNQFAEDLLRLHHIGHTGPSDSREGVIYLRSTP
jgi:transmembrane sensor